MLQILLYFSLLSPLAAMLIGWKQRFTLLWFYVATGLFFDLLGTFLKMAEVNNKWAANLFVLAEFLFISAYYRKAIFKSKLYFSIFISIIALVFIAYTFSRSVLDFNTFGYSLFCLVYVIYGLYGFYTIVKESNQIFLGRSSFFWTNVAIFIYASAVFLLFLFRYYLQEKDPLLFETLWTTFFFIINIQRYLLIGVAMYKTPEREPD